MEFLGREKELESLNNLLEFDGGALGVVWGRRRIGKTRLLVEWVNQHKGLYWVADESGAAIQMNYFAEAVAQYFSGFNDVNYPDWWSLLRRLAKEAKAHSWRGPLVIDELPYLAMASPELASILQKWIDHEVKEANLVVVLAGSSQRMMQGLVLDANAPLYGRATCLLNMEGLPITYIGKGLGLLEARDWIKAYTLWGGVPRYWELAAPYRKRIEAAAVDLVLNPSGVLHNEPNRLLLDEQPNAIHLRPVLDAIGLGANRLSEIAARLNQPSTSLSRPLQRLQEMGLVKRETCAGENEKSTKRTFYKLSDPFFRFWFSTVASRRGQIAGASNAARHSLLQRTLPGLIQATWENLCRASVSVLRLWDRDWETAKRYWHGNEPEWDLVAKSFDDDAILLGEAKWSEKTLSSGRLQQLLQDLTAKGLPKIRNIKSLAIFYVLLIPELPKSPVKLPENVRIIDAKTLFSV